MNSIPIWAQWFAAGAHGAVKQKRKYTGEHYVEHPLGVCEILGNVPHTTEMLQAAMLHDVLEDTGVTEEYLRDWFSPKVVDMVVGLTDVSKPEDGNRAARKAIDRAHLANQSPDVKTIKLADLLHNSVSIIRYDEKFAKVFIAEVRLLLVVLVEGNNELHTQLSGVVRSYYDNFVIGN